MPREKDEPVPLFLLLFVWFLGFFAHARQFLILLLFSLGVFLAQISGLALLAIAFFVHRVLLTQFGCPTRPNAREMRLFR